MIAILLLIGFFQQAFYCSDQARINHIKTYIVENLEKKYKQNEPMSYDEVKYYACYSAINMQQQNYFTQLFWVMNYLAMQIIMPLVQKYTYPIMSTIFTKIKFKKKLKQKKYNINFSNIAGYEYIKKLFQPIIENLINQKKLKKLEKVDGILLYGEPGCGKTYFVKALANEIGIPMISILMKDLIAESGLIIDKIDILFESLKELSNELGPLILFLDEIDFLMANRSNEKIDQNIKLVLQNFLDILDGDQELKGICVIGCTNYKERIDSALLRSGRIGTSIEITKPTNEDIVALIRMYSEKFNINLNDKEILSLADSFIGLSVTDIIKELKILTKK